MVKEATTGSSFVFRPTTNGSGYMVEFTRYDRDGAPLSKKLYPLREYEGGMLSRERSKLYTLVMETLAGQDGKLREAFLLVRPVNPDAPEMILEEEQYQKFSLLKNRIAEQIGRPVLP
jgi:hypothetical protein